MHVYVDGSPCLDVPNEAEGNKYYSLGPPYIFHKEDGERIAESWTNFVPRVYEGYPYLLAEMYAYSMAAAHEKLPHLRMDQFMVQILNLLIHSFIHSFIIKCVIYNNFVVIYI